MPPILAGVAVFVAAVAVRPRPGPRRPGGSPARSTIRARQPTWRSLVALRTRTRSVEPSAVAMWCESLARVVRSGSTLAAAIDATDAPEHAGDTIDDLRLRVRRGARLADALAVRTSSPHLNLALNVLRACAVNGGPPAEPLDRAAATLRGRAADVAERRTQSAQARMSALVMTTLPVAMLGVLIASSSSTRAVVASPAGIGLLTAGAALNVLGWTWARRIISKAST